MVDPKPDRPTQPFITTPKNFEASLFFQQVRLPIQTLPSELFSYFDAEFKLEKLALEKKLRDWGYPPLTTGNRFQLLEELEHTIIKAEANRRPQLLDYFRRAIDSQFSHEVREAFVHFDLGPQSVEQVMRKEPLGDEKVHPPEPTLFSFFAMESHEISKLEPWEILRREMYNTLSAAWGWKGSHYFLFDDGGTYQREFPDLHALQLKFNDLCRYVTMIAVADQYNKNGVPEFRNTPTGRESISVHGQSTQNEFAEAEIELTKIQAYATGVHSWLLAHESSKAAFEISTALEAAPRLKLNAAERFQLHTLTDGDSNEYRQLLLGPYFEKRFYEIIEVFFRRRHNRALDQHTYRIIIERLFSAPVAVFQWFGERAFRADFLTDEKALQEAERVLGEYNIFDDPQVEH